MLPNSSDTVTPEMVLDANGFFRDTIFLEKPMRANLVIQQQDKAIRRLGVYLYPGADLKVALNGSKPVDNISYSGEGKEIADYLLAKAKIEEQDKDLNPSNMVKKGMTITPQEAFGRAEKQHQQLVENLKQHKTLSTSFIASEENELKYLNIDKLSLIVSLNKDSNENLELELPKKYQKEVANIPNDLGDVYKNSRSYQLVLIHKKEEHVKKVKQENPQLSEAEIVFSWLHKIPNQYIKNDMALTTAFRELDGFDITAEKLKKIYQGYLSIATNQEHIDMVAEHYQGKIAIAPGQPSPNFENYINYEGGTTSLADLKGKYVYIDLWATWCVPCLAEVPALKKLEKEYHNTKLQFVSISVDFKENEDGWRKMIKEKKLPGMHLLADNANNSKFIKDYKIPGVPRFIILGPEGEIITPKAYFPSDPKLRTMLNTLDI
ncbi:TlpA disulfide reductase family protein [uncultured Algibacter sp.]|uniref:TlpA family protein disulfide reductase n=1 Tax=uncultured Algibacter sp. TaxID=298659 RepID=UPI0032166F65